MKLAKFGIFALALGLFAASCGDSTTEDGTDTDTMMVAPMQEPAPMTTPDTMVAAPAMGTDTMMMNSGSTMDTMKK